MCKFGLHSIREKKKINYINNIYSGEEKEKACDERERCSKSIDQLEHSKNKSNEKLYRCSLCPKSFLLLSRLKRHNRIHKSKKPYRCSECTKSFGISNHLKQHMRVHTGEKPYRCSKCTKSFTRSDCLKLHIRIHAWEKP